jgi:hypothetical protein
VGVLDGAEFSEPDEGTVQGSIISLSSPVVSLTEAAG